MTGGGHAGAGRRLCIEGTKKTALCIGAAIAVGAVLPYSFAFAFQVVTYLGFTVALAEGLLSAFAEILEDPDWAVTKITEAIETLGASVALVAVQVAYLAFA
jgi:hypothetical protein